MRHYGVVLFITGVMLSTLFKVPLSFGEEDDALNDEFCNIDQGLPEEPEMKLEKRVLYVEGTIGHSLLTRIKQDQPRLLILNSMGGDSEAGTIVAEKVYEMGIDTQILTDGNCWSACAEIFLAGKKRVMHESAMLVLHATRAGPCYMSQEYDPICRVRGRRYCQKIHDEMYDLLYRETEKSFRAIEKFTGRAKLFEHYLKISQDPQWENDGNLLKLKDWGIPSDQALRIGFVHEVLKE